MGEKHQCVVASCTPPTRDLACVPTGDRTHHLSVLRLALNPLSHSSQGQKSFISILEKLPPSSPFLEAQGDGGSRRRREKGHRHHQLLRREREMIQD